MKHQLLLLFAFLMMAFCPGFAQEPDYLCFTAEESGDYVKLTPYFYDSSYPLPVISLEYKLGDGAWVSYTLDTEISLPNVGDKVYLRATSTNPAFCRDDYNSWYYFELGGKTAASGNIMSLLDKTCTQTSVPDNAFNSLFDSCDDLTSAPSLPATTLGIYCYQLMFCGCISLNEAPALPATNLAEGCYAEMFQQCSGLTIAPLLPATELADYCYMEMFLECTKLYSLPLLPAKNMAEECYEWMFQDCTNLVISTTGPGKPWSLPSDLVIASDWDWRMLIKTTGEFWAKDDGPIPGSTYYIRSANADVTLNSEGYATYSTPHDAKINTAGVKAYKASVTGETITLTELEGDYIPGGTGILLYGEGMAGTVVTFDRVFSGSPADVSGNDLKATTKDDYSLAVAETNTWALGDGTEFLSFTGSEYIHNRAYLVHTAPSSAPLRISGSAEATGISTIDVAPETDVIYTLDGQRVNNAAKGLFIMNGKKLIIK